MKFIIDEVDINFDRMELTTCYNWRYRGRIIPRFYFVTDKFISMSCIATLKFNKSFLYMLKDKCTEAIEHMSDEDFIRIQESIRNVIANQNYTKVKSNKMNLMYSNTTKDRTGVTRIYFEDNLSNFVTVPETKQDLSLALISVSAKDIVKS
jgi:hypothetical protein